MKSRVSQSGFTLVELAVVVVIIGVLAAFAVPRFLNSVERSKSAEAFNFLSTVQSGQERFHARQGTYASTLDEFDVEFVTSKYFDVGEITADEAEWTMTFTRIGASAGYGDYTVVYTHEGFDSDTSTLPDDISPLQTDGGGD